MSTLFLEGVSKHFGGLKAVDDVTLTVPKGGITGLIGPNGAGKSTVVNMIAGVLTLTRGSIRLGDTPIGAARSYEVAHAGITRTFQNIRLLPEATVMENVLLGFHRHRRAGLLSNLLGLPAALRENRELREKSHALLRRFKLDAFAEFEAGNLAYGHQRRVEMARAVASDPDILLLDEPVAGMNEIESEELAVIFRELAAGGMGLLLIEHNVGFVKRLCQQLYVLDSGRLIASGDPDTVTRDPRVIEAYIGTSGY